MLSYKALSQLNSGHDSEKFTINERRCQNGNEIMSSKEGQLQEKHERLDVGGVTGAANGGGGNTGRLPVAKLAE
jgi:hypothetical protein